MRGREEIENSVKQETVGKWPWESQPLKTCEVYWRGCWHSTIWMEDGDLTQFSSATGKQPRHVRRWGGAGSRHLGYVLSCCSNPLPFKPPSKCHFLHKLMSALGSAWKGILWGVSCKVPRTEDLVLRGTLLAARCSKCDIQLSITINLEYNFMKRVSHKERMVYKVPS